MKTCSKCNLSKPLDQFYKHKTNKDGLWGCCKDCDRLGNKKWYSENKDKHLLNTKNYFTNNKEKWKEYDKNFRQNNPKTPEQKLHRTIFDGIRRGCKNLNHVKDQSSLETIGLESWDKFREHIESQFTEGMTWENYGNKSENWSIDHIIPISSAKTENDIYKLNNYTNLRPMWHSDNVKKRNKI